jgi:DNA-binding NarL/FixJ family response regulator
MTNREAAAPVLARVSVSAPEKFIAPLAAVAELRTPFPHADHEMSRFPHTAPGFALAEAAAPRLATIAFLEDDATYREYLEAIVRASGRYVIAGSFHSVGGVLDGLPADGADLVLVDVRLSGRSGIAAIARLRERWPILRCIVLTGSEEGTDLFAALEAGAAGYLLKSDSDERILAGLAEAMQGGAPLSRSIARRVVGSFAAKTRAPAVTGREREIMQELARGLTYKEIGRKLGISGATVKNHLYRIYEKIGVRSRTEAVVKWLKR